MNTAAPIDTAARYGRIRSRSNANLGGTSVSMSVSGTSSSCDQRVHRHGQPGDEEERRGDPERTDQHRRDRRADREATDVGGEHATEVLPQVIRIGEDHDSPRRRIGKPDADAHHESRRQQQDERRAECHAQQTDHVEHHSENDHRSGVASVGQRGQCHLSDERRQESHRHDQSERALADAVLVAELVEHGEHHPVARCEQPCQRAEDNNGRRRAHPASIAEPASKSAGIVDECPNFPYHSTNVGHQDRRRLRRRRRSPAGGARPWP